MSFDALYSFLESYFNQEPYSLDYFCKAYLNRCKELGLFEIFIEHLRKNILYPNNYIENDNDLFTSLVFMTTSDKQLNVKLWRLWNESYNGLRYELQQLFVYHLKLAIDRRIGETVISYGPYESMLFEFKNEYYTITIEYRCVTCDSSFVFYLQIPILGYLEKLFNGIRIEKVDASKPGEPTKYIQCSECNGEMMKFTII